MRRRSELKLIFGMLIWTGLLGVGMLYSRGAVKDSTAGPMRVARFLSTPYREVELEFEPAQVLKIGEPIFVESDGRMTLIGRITHVETVDSTTKDYVYTRTAFADLFSSAPQLGNGDYLTFHETPESFDWVVEMMLPPATREKLSELIVEAYQTHQDELFAAFKPIVEKSLSDAAVIVQQDLERAINNHEQELTRIREKFQADLIKKEIFPLMQKVIWPIVRTEAAPLANVIGQEIWNEVSVWRFTWKYLYDRSPLPERNLAQKEFRRFVDAKVMPILESHLDEILQVQHDILTKVAQNEEVQDTVARSIRDLMTDEEVRFLVTGIFQEVFVHNQRLKDLLEKNLNSPESQHALAITNERLEPTITMIGQTLFGSPRGQITPEFSRVLRYKILHKDDQWFVFHSGRGVKTGAELATETTTSKLPVLQVIPGVTTTENPFHIPVEMRDGN